MKKIKKLAVLCASLLLLIAAAGCTKSDGDAENTDSAWPAKLVIAQMPDENNPDAGTKNDSFRTALQDALGIEVEELEGSEYSVGIEAMKAGKLDIMLVSPMSYYQAKRVANVEPLVTTGTQGQAPYKTVFITQAERTDIQTLEDLKGKTFAFVDPASSSGYMYPKAKLVTELDLDPEQLENPDYFFKTVTYSGKHDTSLMGIVNGDYDAAAVAYQVIGSMEGAGLLESNQIKIVGETDIIPNACYLMRGSMPQDLKEKLMEFYLGYEDSTYFEALYGSSDIRFIQVKDEDYAVVDEMVKVLKIEETE